jgi:Fe-S-cluster containining protein
MADAAKQARFVAHDFVALVDGAFSDAARRSGPHLLCRAGCTQCCIGAFAIGPADALRLRQGLAALDRDEPERASRVRNRAADSWSRLAADFPGDPNSGSLNLDENGEPSAAFDDFADDEPCPALDRKNGTCDLYSARPHTCRAFGPPIAAGDGYGLCELCFQHATPQEIAAAAIREPPTGASHTLDRVAVEAGAPSAPTIIAFVLSQR